jgi:NAD(P)H-hydrate repair Nnr-like enzyme with NAD(P)H-hydrate epimerase domain
LHAIDLPQKLTTPVDIIIDALLGSQTTLADLRADREAFHTVTTAMDWANDNKAPVLSLDFPSGIDPLQGNRKNILYYYPYVPAFINNFSNQSQAHRITLDTA